MFLLIPKNSAFINILSDGEPLLEKHGLYFMDYGIGENGNVNSSDLLKVTLCTGHFGFLPFHIADCATLCA